MSRTLGVHPEERLQLREEWLRKQRERRQTQEEATPQVQQAVSPPHEELA